MTRVMVVTIEIIVEEHSEKVRRHLGILFTKLNICWWGSVVDRPLLGVMKMVA